MKGGAGARGPQRATGCPPVATMRTLGLGPPALLRWSAEGEEWHTAAAESQGEANSKQEDTQPRPASTGSDDEGGTRDGRRNKQGPKSSPTPSAADTQPSGRVQQARRSDLTASGADFRHPARL